jgi:hypothetical protein
MNPDTILLDAKRRGLVQESEERANECPSARDHVSGRRNRVRKGDDRADEFPSVRDQIDGGREVPGGSPSAFRAEARRLG